MKYRKLINKTTILIIITVVNNYVHRKSVNLDKTTYNVHYNIQKCPFLYKNLEIIQKNIHRGDVLRKAVEATGSKVGVIAKKAGYKRGTYYLHRQKENLSLEILAKYGKAIGHNFADDLPAMSKFLVEEEDKGNKHDPTTVEGAVKQRDEWKDKYYALMDKYSVLMDKYLEAIKPDH